MEFARQKLLKSLPLRFVLVPRQYCAKAIVAEHLALKEY